MQLHYRVVTVAGANRLHKTYFKSYTLALAYFNRSARRLSRFGYAELQELEAGAWLTAEEALGAGF